MLLPGILVKMTDDSEGVDFCGNPESINFLGKLVRFLNIPQTFLDFGTNHRATKQSRPLRQISITYYF